MVFQRPNPFPTMSIRDNVLAGVKLNNQKISKGEADALVERSLQGANLWNEVKDRLEKPGSGLSGGQQQRLCIARAIAVEPQVILMDEPCSALDPISTLAIEDLINELKDQYTVVIVTHNMQQAARVSDKTAFFNIAGTGKPGKLIEFAEHQHHLQQPEPEGHRGLRLRPLRIIPTAALASQARPGNPGGVGPTTSLATRIDCVQQRPFGSSEGRAVGSCSQDRGGASAGPLTRQGDIASSSTKAPAAVATGVRTQSHRIRITSFRLVTAKFWFSPAPSTDAVTVCVVETGQCRPIAPMNSRMALKLWATDAPQRINPGDLVADGVRDAPTAEQRSDGDHHGGQQRHPQRDRAAVGIARRQQGQEQHGADPLAVLQAVAEGDGPRRRSTGCGAEALVDDAGLRVARGPGDREDQQVRADEGDDRGEHQRQDNLDTAGTASTPPTELPPTTTAGESGARQAAHQGMRGGRRDAAPPQQQAPGAGAGQACHQDGQAAVAVGQGDPVLADGHRQRWR